MATLAEPEARTDPQDDFRQEARSWIAENFPAALKGKDNAMSAIEGGGEPSADEELWRVAMGKKGWGVPTWPRASFKPKTQRRS